MFLCSHAGKSYLTLWPQSFFLFFFFLNFERQCDFRLSTPCMQLGGWELKAEAKSFCLEREENKEEPQLEACTCSSVQCGCWNSVTKLGAFAAETAAGTTKRFSLQFKKQTNTHTPISKCAKNGRKQGGDGALVSWNARQLIHSSANKLLLNVCCGCAANENLQSKKGTPSKLSHRDGDCGNQTGSRSRFLLPETSAVIYGGCWTCWKWKWMGNTASGQRAIRFFFVAVVDTGSCFSNMALKTTEEDWEELEQHDCEQRGPCQVGFSASQQ